ncbi:MAG: hypothetical protein ACRELY_25035 [Polyangiaceae bacterium]
MRLKRHGMTRNKGETVLFDDNLKNYDISRTDTGEVEIRVDVPKGGHILSPRGDVYFLSISAAELATILEHVVSTSAKDGGKLGTALSKSVGAFVRAALESNREDT